MRAKTINETFPQRKVSSGIFQETWARDDIKLGDYVITSSHGHEGRVYQKHHDFKHTGENEDWFSFQSPKYDPVVKNYPWLSILVKAGGAVVVPISDIKEVVEPFDLNNKWESFYF